MTRHQRVHAILVALFTAVVTSCGGDDSEPRSTGRPPAPPSFLEDCAGEDDCSDGLTCAQPVLIKTICTLPCETDADCPAGSGCWDRSYCTDFLQDLF